jgi:hypothetical protein
MPRARQRKVERFEPVTLGHIRGHGCRDLLVYCVSGRCHHSATLNGDWLPDETPVRSLCPRMVCTVCGMIGADVRPDWSPQSTSRESDRSSADTGRATGQEHEAADRARPAKLKPPKNSRDLTSQASMFGIVGAT